MARQVLPVIGAAIGGYFGGAQGAQWGWAIGSVVGNAVDPQIIKGPSIGDIAQQTSQEGVPRPIVFALSPPIAGNVIATGPPRTVKHSERQGKGGPKVETESVYRTYAIGICEGPIGSFIRIWRNGILVYDAINGVSADNAHFLEHGRFFLGDFDQNPSPDLEAIFGVGLTPAHRGSAYLVMADEDLTDLRGAVPQYMFQVGSELNCVEVTDYSNDVIYPWNFDNVDPRNLCNAYTYRFYNSGVERETLGQALADAPYSLVDKVIGYNSAPTLLQMPPYQPLSPHFDDPDTLYLFFNHYDFTTQYHDLWNVASDGDVGPFVQAHGSGFWWDGHAIDIDYYASHGVFFSSSPIISDLTFGFPVIQAWLKYDNAIEVKRIPAAPQNPCESSCGTSFVAAPIEGYCIDDNGSYIQGGEWTLDPITYHVLQRYVVASSEVTHYPLNPARPSGHPEFDDEEFWTTAYEEAVAIGSMPAGLVYGTHYPQSEDHGWSRTYERCSLGDGGILLSELITELCARVGLTQIQTPLVDPIVRGFAITNTYPCSAALQALSQVFFFDPSNHDGLVHFISRGGNSIATVTEMEMVEDDSQIEESKRADAIAIPRVLNLNYFDVNGGLATDKQSSERAGDRRSIGEASLQSAVVMNADEAATVITVNHKVMIEDQKAELRFSLPDSRLLLAAADPVIVQWQGRSERCRITQCDIQDGYQEITAVRDRQSAYTQTVEGIPAASQTPPPSSIVGPTLIEPLDIPMLRDADDSLGYYVAISGILSAWQGATVELSLDGGVNYIQSETTRTAAIMGETLSVLADHPDAFPDEVNSVSVRIDTPLAELHETDLEGLLNRQNLALIGNEIIQFSLADETSEGEWTLSYFLRGRKGTTAELHSIGSRFILLERGAVPFIQADLTELNRTLTFRATSFGAAPSTGTVVSMIFTGISQKERQPAYLEARIEGGDVIISWQGVGRLGGGANVAQGAYFVGYRITITDGVLTQSFDVVDQVLVEDISMFASPITIRVQQRNQLTGLGPPIEVII